ncbi:hypothetical protein [Thiothrix eikelboomii]|uniref:YfdX protein n=1 Tax=Thiothrix eikelboomii TaxID=92487 RepID=A0A1T4Y0E8_9GAMM|nr:hypothetical protein [Thiothrix eikelboomii]SKA95272.1 hypothetical protein SAMN02745130_03745 [Thiothrix eikelboomii]
MKFFRRSLLASFLAGIYFNSIALANTPLDSPLSLDELLNPKVIAQTLNSGQTQLALADTQIYAKKAAALVEQLEYQPSLARRQVNLSDLAAQRQVQHLNGADELEALLSSAQVIEAIEQTIQPYGLGINNLADVYTLWWITAWQASEGELSKIDKQTAQAVKQQAMLIWLANPKLAQATDTHKQAIAEALLIQALLTQAAINRAGDDQQAKQVVKEAVRQGAAASGLVLEQMQLTAQGFVIRP